MIGALGEATAIAIAGAKCVVVHPLMTEMMPSPVEMRVSVGGRGGLGGAAVDGERGL